MKEWCCLPINRGRKNIIRHKDEWAVERKEIKISISMGERLERLEIQ